jgi:hypothetical protein
MASSLNGTGVSFSDSTTMITGKQAAKAWVNWAGSNGAINSSYNVSSVTRTATGFYTITFTNAFANTNYALAGSTNDWAMAMYPVTSSTVSANTFQTTNGSNRDNSTNYLAAYG